MKNSLKVTIACVIIMVSVISFFAGSLINKPVAYAALESAGVFGTQSAATTATQAWIEGHDLGHDPVSAGKKARQFYEAFMGY